MDPEGLWKAVVAAFAGQPGITQAKMFGAPGLRVGGKVFATLWKDTLVVKLPQARVDALLAAGRGQRFDPGMGRLMKEWIAVPPTDEAAWVGLAQEAKEFVAKGARQ
ncbi:MAG: TfoX/Sxy family protein [Chloroflexi bacterium]|nr:TfoX/Sxy family protein [Chloroflexota bacterium]